MKKTIFPLEGARESDEHDELGYVGLKNKIYNRHPIRLKKKITQFWMDTATFPIEYHEHYFNFIFVDASHAYENVLNDSKTVIKCIADNGFIIWHDYNGWPGVTKALNEFYSGIEDQHNFVQIMGTSLAIYYKEG